MGYFEQNPLGFFCAIALIAATFGWIGAAVRARLRG